MRHLDPKVEDAIGAIDMGDAVGTSGLATRAVHGLLMNRRRCSRSVYMAGPTVGTKSPERCVAPGHPIGGRLQAQREF